MSELTFRQALVRISNLWRADMDSEGAQAVKIAREALLAEAMDTGLRPTLAPFSALPDYDA